jgi:methyltransferase (TIGR00027 family)
MAEPLVSQVSDTARWVAVYRAWESQRPDALFSDPFAGRLAGERGQAMAKLMPRNSRSGWPMIARTKLIDDLVAAAVREGCDCVLNLAAGLDTRPYRLALPASLPWVEADLPGMIEEKEKLLETEKPACGLTRMKVNLTDAAERSSFLDRVLEDRKNVLAMTEGLLVYLDAAEVRTLGRDFAARGVRWWILDLASPEILKMMRRQVGAQLANAPMKFAPSNGVAFFEALGWEAREIHSIVKAAVRFRRIPFFLRPFCWLPEPDPRKLGRSRWSAVVRLELGR